MTARLLDADPAYRSLAAETGSVQNIAGGGLAFASPQRFAPGAMIAVEIARPGSRSAIVALARVNECRRRDDHNLVTAELWWLAWRNGDLQARITEVVESALGLSSARDLVTSGAGGS